MKNIFLFTVTLLFINFNIDAQNTTKKFEEDFNHAEKIFSEVYQDGKDEALTYSKGGYLLAVPLLKQLYIQDETNMNLAFKIGVCYLSSRKERSAAIPYFTQAVTNVSAKCKSDSYKEKSAPIIAHKYLGDALHLDYKFDAAINAYNKFISSLEENNVTDEVLLKETKRKIEMCKTGKLLVANPVVVTLENLGRNVNSAYGDYSLVLTADENNLYFTSRRPESTGGIKDDDGNYMEDIYTCTKTESGWSKAENIGAPINTEWHEATIGISPDGQTILIYKDDKGDGNIYSTSLNGDIWSKPIKLNDNINTKHWEPSAFISADGNTIYFISDKPGGFGGRDMYMSKKNTEGDWDKSVNMGPNINTIYDEEAPFIHADGVTLSFSSNGHNTMGGFDIFTSLLSDNLTWSEPINVGYPINTTYDDIFFAISPDGLNAYFSSFHKDGFGEKDNFMATFPESKATPLTLLKGLVNDESGKPAKNVVITVTDNVTGEIVGIYHTNKKTGQFLFILIPGKNYNITYQAEGHLFNSENIDIPKASSYYEINRAVMLDPISVGSKIILNNIFFDFDKATLRPLSNVEIKNLLLLMKSNPGMKVEISGHTDSKGSAAYNQKLSEQRAQAVVKRLIESGISANRMVAKGYGKTMPAASNNKANGSDDPIGRQLNRRVELKITELN